MAENTPVPVHRSDSVLRNVTWSVFGLGAISIFALLIGRLIGISNFAVGAWPTIAIMPLIALPIFFLLIVAQLVVSAVRRSRAAKDATE